MKVYKNEIHNINYSFFQEWMEGFRLHYFIKIRLISIDTQQNKSPPLCM